MSGLTAPVAYFWGEDAYALEHAVTEFAATLGTPQEALAIWRASGDDDASDESAATAAAGRRRDRLLSEIDQRLATAPLFGGGTLVVVRQPDTLIREGTARARLIAMVGRVPLGNGLCFVDLVASGARGPAGAGALHDAVKTAGGLTRQFPALTRERMEGWIVGRAAELGSSLAPGAARLLAERIGAYVRETDIDRRRQTELADQELQKLALYRPGGAITREDVVELVPETVPGSAWAFLDAVGLRRQRDAALLAERLIADATPAPVLIAQLHRRLRELVVVQEHLETGTRGPALMRAMKLQPFRAEKLEQQGRQWTGEGLMRAIEGLLELDLASKGIALDGSTHQMSDGRTALGIQQWLAETLVG
jgi:DNA polymerase III delta subunit